MKKPKYIFASTFALLAGIALMGAGCDVDENIPKPKSEIQQANQIQKEVARNIPVPPIKNSSERANVAKRAELFDTQNKISYIYLINYGRVMAYYTVNGKVSSLGSYMTPTDKLVFGNGQDCNEGDQWGSSDDSGDCYVVSAPDLDGTYGENVDGIFFFTTEGIYVEWKGDYMMSDEPLKLTEQPALIRQVQ